MPGSLFELRCQGCRVLHKIETGISRCWDHGTAWEYELWVCPRCRVLVSRQSDYCCRELGPECESCGGQLERWSGLVWHERNSDGSVGAERVEGPCPACGSTLRESDSELFGLWD